MAQLNIPSSVDDPAYRYKMPRLVSRKEGRGNGSKTGILNMGDVARALKRDPVYITKFIGYELGAQSAYTNKENEGERVVINGHHDTPIFQTLVDKFIEKYVLCPGCKLPEIDMIVKKGTICAGCKACGWGGDLDNHHKIATYICKNPPGTGIGFDGGEQKKSREERQRERAAKQKKKGDEEGTDTGDDSFKGEDRRAPPVGGGGGAPQIAHRTIAEATHARGGGSVRICQDQTGGRARARAPVVDPLSASLPTALEAGSAPFGGAPRRGGRSIVPASLDRRALAPCRMALDSRASRVFTHTERLWHFHAFFRVSFERDV